MERYTIDRLTAQDLEQTALALFRAGYCVKKCRRKEGNKVVTYLEYWRESQ